MYGYFVWGGGWVSLEIVREWVGAVWCVLLVGRNRMGEGWWVIGDGVVNWFGLVGFMCK